MLGSSVFGGRLDGAQRVDVWSNSWGSTRLSASSGKVVVFLLTIFRLMDARRVLYLFASDSLFHSFGGRAVALQFRQRTRDYMIFYSENEGLLPAC